MFTCEHFILDVIEKLQEVKLKKEISSYLLLQITERYNAVQTKFQGIIYNMTQTS